MPANPAMEKTIKTMNAITRRGKKDAMPERYYE